MDSCLPYLIVVFILPEIEKATGSSSLRAPKQTHTYEFHHRNHNKSSHHSDAMLRMGTEADYPYDEIRKALEQNKLLKDYFVARPVTPEIGNRYGGDGGETLCRVREAKLLYPKQLPNVNNVWKTVVNIQGEYEQGVETRTCYGDGGTCTRLDSLPLGQMSYCHQEYMVKELMIYHNGTPAFDWFKFPSCCVCKIKTF